MLSTTGGGGHTPFNTLRVTGGEGALHVFLW